MHEPAAAPDGHTTITFLQTGTCQIKTVMYTQPATRSMALRRLNIFTGKEWTDPLPIGAFLVKHSSGPFLFDAGESTCCNNPGYFPMWTKPIQSLSTTQINPEDSIVKQLRKHGVEPKDLKGIVLSHLHHDHAGGLDEIIIEAPEVPIYISKPHWVAFGTHPFKASIQGSAPQHWPKSFPPRMLELKKEPVGPWTHSYPLTDDGRIVAVDTPGHVPGHVSLVVRCENDNGTDTTYFLTGDATYGIALLEAEETDGVNDDPVRALESLRMIKEFARQQEVVVLPSHDADTPRLLAEKIAYSPKSLSKK
ncbi:metallo-beta-lactamase superfamily protein [Pleomassaria siparia CBS 279.74]|uniref:Metallo-beta-lactamase superfamily protein n=1 Tax=Pleomassaria siparia CBS 279.74 TaxID=1314801 RepID=A0A6G1KKI2_9PLEO|nr:metallo-beta-lactamase superfamily protein [Pleomassaria siparia CBS 279.74]